MTNSLSLIRSELEESQNVLREFLVQDSNLKAIEHAADLLVKSIKSGGKIITCGNGGSHCDAMHFAEELTGRYRENRKPLPAIAISDPTHISCVGNDFGYEHVFSRFIEGLGKKGDILFAISTSGNSVNVINAVEAAKEKGMVAIGLTGKDGGQLVKILDHEIRVAHQGYADRIQEVHIKIIHILMLLIEKQLV